MDIGRVEIAPSQLPKVDGAKRDGDVKALDRLKLLVYTRFVLDKAY